MKGLRAFRLEHGAVFVHAGRAAFHEDGVFRRGELAEAERGKFRRGLGLCVDEEFIAPVGARGAHERRYDLSGKARLAPLGGGGDHFYDGAIEARRCDYVFVAVLGERRAVRRALEDEARLGEQAFHRAALEPVKLFRHAARYAVHPCQSFESLRFTISPMAERGICEINSMMRGTL